LSGMSSKFSLRQCKELFLFHTEKGDPVVVAFFVAFIRPILVAFARLIIPANLLLSFEK
jgi:hypothetical protein